MRTDVRRFFFPIGLSVLYRYTVGVSALFLAPHFLALYGLFVLSLFFFTHACCISYYHLLHCINNTGVHTTGNRKGSAIKFFWGGGNLQRQILSTFWMWPSELIKTFYVQLLVLWITGYYLPSTSPAVMRLRKHQPWANSFHHQCTKSLIFSFEIIHFQKERGEWPQLTFTGVVITLVFLLYLYGLFRCMHYEYGRS